LPAHKCRGSSLVQSRCSNRTVSHGRVADDWLAMDVVVEGAAATEPLFEALYLVMLVERVVILGNS
jgi:hypothetical protein